MRPKLRGIDAGKRAPGDPERQSGALLCAYMDGKIHLAKGSAMKAETFHQRAARISWERTGTDPAARRARTARARMASVRAQLRNLAAEGLLIDGDTAPDGAE
jgi:hypothetical protein